MIITRFSVPRPDDPKNFECHPDPAWLKRRLELFRSFFAPPVGRLNVPAVPLHVNGKAIRLEAAFRTGFQSEVAEVT